MPLPSDSHSVLTAELASWLSDALVIRDTGDTPAPPSGPVVFVRHSRDIQSEDQWSRNIVTEFSIIHLDSVDTPSRIAARYSTPYTVVSQGHTYQLLLRSTIDTPEIVRGVLYPQTIQTMVVSYLLSELESAWPILGGTVTINAGGADAANIPYTVPSDIAPDLPSGSTPDGQLTLHDSQILLDSNPIVYT